MSTSKTLRNQMQPLDRASSWTLGMSNCQCVHSASNYSACCWHFWWSFSPSNSQIWQKTHSVQLFATAWPGFSVDGIFQATILEWVANFYFTVKKSTLLEVGISARPHPPPRSSFRWRLACQMFIRDLGITTYGWERMSGGQIVQSHAPLQSQWMSIYPEKEYWKWITCELWPLT